MSITLSRTAVVPLRDWRRTRLAPCRVNAGPSPTRLPGLRNPSQCQQAGPAGKQSPRADAERLSDTARLPVLGMVASAVTFMAWAGPALADDVNAQLTLADPGNEPTFTSFLIMLCLGYWIAKAVSYFWVENRDEPQDGKPGSDDLKPGQQKQKKGMDLTSHSKAPIRTFIEAGPAPGQDAQEYRNKSLARSAVYHVATAVKESQPRIHAMLVAEAASCRLRAASSPSSSASNGASSSAANGEGGHAAHTAGATAAASAGAAAPNGTPGIRFKLPVGPTAHDLAANDPVAQLVAQHVDHITAAQGCEALDSESHALIAIEQQLLEELAQQVAREEIDRLKAMATAGELRVDGKKCSGNAAGAGAGGKK